MPETASKNKNRKKLWWLLVLAAIFFVVFYSVKTALAIFDKAFEGKIYPNTFVGRLNLSGKSAEQAKLLINQELDKISQRGITFSYKKKPAVINPVVASAGGDLAYQLIIFNVD